jgi:hypothetical protein
MHRGHLPDEERGKTYDGSTVADADGRFVFDGETVIPTSGHHTDADGALTLSEPIREPAIASRRPADFRGDRRSPAAETGEDVIPGAGPGMSGPAAPSATRMSS